MTKFQWSMWLMVFFVSGFLGGQLVTQYYKQEYVDVLSVKLEQCQETKVPECKKTLEQTAIQLTKQSTDKEWCQSELAYCINLVKGTYGNPGRQNTH